MIVSDLLQCFDTVGWVTGNGMASGLFKVCCSNPQNSPAYPELTLERRLVKQNQQTVLDDVSRIPGERDSEVVQRRRSDEAVYRRNGATF